MADRTVTLTITIPEDIDEDLGGLGVFLDASGVDPETVPPLVLAAVEATRRAQLAEAFTQTNPMATGDIIQGMAALNARLSLIDMLMHLPMTGGEVASFHVDVAPPAP